MSDEELIASYRAGNGQALASLMEAYQPMIRSLSSQYFLADGDNDDLIQEGQIGLFKAITKFDPGLDTKFSSYAYICIKGEIRHAVERSNRMYNLILNGAVSLTGEDGESVEIADTAERDPEKILLSREKAQDLLARINEALSPLEREVLSLSMDGNDYVEIAGALGREPKSIDNAIQRLRKKAKAALAED